MVELAVPVDSTKVFHEGPWENLCVAFMRNRMVPGGGQHLSWGGGHHKPDTWAKAMVTKEPILMEEVVFDPADGAFQLVYYWRYIGPPGQYVNVGLEDPGHHYGPARQPEPGTRLVERFALDQAPGTTKGYRVHCGLSGVRKCYWHEITVTTPAPFYMKSPFQVVQNGQVILPIALALPSSASVQILFELSAPGGGNRTRVTVDGRRPRHQIRYAFPGRAAQLRLSLLDRPEEPFTGRVLRLAGLGS